MDSANTLISVIIPTTCEAQRWASLRRAIESVMSQREVGNEVIVIVNGDRVDRGRFNELSSMPGLKVMVQEEGSLPLALRYGRSLVATPFFCFLDDDDEYLPGALWRRLQPMLADETVDYVASNGYSYIEGRDEQRLTNIDAIRNDPLRALLEQNWLASCGGLYRSARVSIDYFDGKTRYLEWTLLAYKLATSMKVVFVEVPTFRVHDSPGSLSKSTQYLEAEIGVLAQILSLELPVAVKQGLRVKMGKACHSLSHHYLVNEGNLKRAWRHHLSSLRYPGGLRYLTYSLRLLAFRLRFVT